MDRDATVVGVVAKGWHKGPMGSKVNPHCHRIVPFPSHGAGQHLRSHPVLPGGALLHSCTVSPPHTKRNIVCGKAELCE